jgi:hypothetical protein
MVARVYLVYEKDKFRQYSAEFDEIAALLAMKTGKEGFDDTGHKHGPDCGHVH